MGGCRNGRPSQLWQARRLSRRAHARCGGCRRCAGGCICRCPCQLAENRCSGKARSLAACRCAPARRRYGEATTDESSGPRASGADDGRDGGGNVRARDPRRAAETHVRLCTSGDRAWHSCPADPANDPRFRRGDDRLGVSHCTGNHGPKAGSGQEPHSRNRHSLSHSRMRRPWRAAGCRSRGDLRRLRGRLDRSGRNGDASAQSGDGSDLAGPAGRAFDADGTGGASACSRSCSSPKHGARPDAI